MDIKFDLEADIASNPEILGKVITRDDYAQNLYAAMCNMRWQKLDVLPILKEEHWSCSWRAAGGIIAELRGNGDYMDWYCSGMGGFGMSYEEDPEWKKRNYVPEGQITKEIQNDLRILGWIPSPWPEDKA